MPYRKLTRDEHFTADGPKRILALDGGGLRGVLSLGFLAKLESILRDRHGASDLTYERYNVSLAPEQVLQLKPGLDQATLESLPKMDEPDNLEILRELGDIAAGSQVKPEHFPQRFDLSA